MEWWREGKWIVRRRKLRIARLKKKRKLMVAILKRRRRQ